ncbi:D-psicose/D-tagatose/L-ribulose 3-epimerase [Pontibacter ummariensis]|uniref:D-psicose/D-tagatose/L-ribulose 3-epimerase n=1 Tax=Pontibacter ummariensis TaxID=1610492 RepID=A0A239LPA7_9BACT|nr:sugar phosphate isomerase/epimerase family protein [Pontibacter ummariensis]PRY02920.1 D-psicose/D-tagatose/L-ribulose 3-epimerase [Pontibacter ummariensis]SNT32281.1 D-psicose/D-tagatose/L-ribulose 3-epimerase [Pontibacter ummariensis]
MNKIGFNLLAWSAVVSDELMPIADRLKTIGYDGIECLIGSPDKVAYKRLGNHVRNIGMEATCVFVVGKDDNPISDAAAVRTKGLERIKWAIDRAHDMQAKVICGPFHSAHATFARRAPEDREFGWSAEVLHAAGEYAAQADITLALEALNRFECYLCNTMRQLTQLVRRVDHPNVKAMFDTHHANIEEKKFDKAIQDIAPVLAHVHISENDRGTPGDGHIDFDAVFSALADVSYSGWITIEAFSRNDPDFANSIGVWREYSTPWDIAENGLTLINQMCLKHGLDKHVTVNYVR